VRAADREAGELDERAIPERNGRGAAARRRRVVFSQPARKYDRSVPYSVCVRASSDTTARTR
jgi:hypothetical protein